MKPKNFPGHRNKRRVGALERLGKGKKGERKALTDRIMPQGQAEGIRTKKDRSKKAK